MSIVQIKSSNPKFSFIIQKNPESQIKLQSIRLGVACGWYSQNNQAYNILFRDAEDEISFKKHKDEEFEYLNTTRYNSALFVINAIDEFLRTAFKTQSTDDSKGFENVFYINLIHAKNSRYIEAFAKYFQDYKVEYEETAKNNYKIRIHTQNSVYELLNFAALFANFIAIVNGEDLFIKEENVVKNLTCLNVIDAPYFVRYLFKIRFLKSDKIYKEYKESLEKTSRGKYEMTFGDNWEARQRFVEHKLSFKRSILDIGCGEGKYITRFSKFVEKNNINYYAVDVDNEVLEDAQRRAKNKGVKNVSFFNSLEQFKQSGITEEVDVILSEVIEHMSVEEAKVLILDILENINFRSLIITTPDARFNVNYFMSEKFRHDDHKFEFTHEEFRKFLSDCAGAEKKHEFAVLRFMVGDCVDNISTTQGAVIIKDWENTGAQDFQDLIKKI
jgi:small RNA 2'-O-methyltransferase